MFWLLFLLLFIFCCYLFVHVLFSPRRRPQDGLARHIKPLTGPIPQCHILRLFLGPYATVLNTVFERVDFLPILIKIVVKIDFPIVPRFNIIIKVLGHLRPNVATSHSAMKFGPICLCLDSDFWRRWIFVNKSRGMTKILACHSTSP